MKRVVLSLLLFNLILCSACGSRQNVPDSKIDNSKSIPEGKIVISVPYYFGSIVDQVENFREAYPGVEVEVRCSNTPGKPFDNIDKMDQYIRQMAVELMSGSDVDVYETSWLSYYKYARSGVLENLYPYMEEDQNFKKEDYYENIFKAFEYDEKLCVLPSHVTYDLLRVNKRVTEIADEKESMNYKELQQLYEEARAGNGNAKALKFSWNDSGNVLVFDRNEFSKYIDFEKEEVTFDQPDFEKYLLFARNYLDWQSTDGKIFYDKDDGREDWLANFFRMDLFTIQENETSVSKPLLLVSSAGDRTFAPVGELLSISSFSKNKELAWEFLMFTISEKEYSFLGDPLSKLTEQDYYMNFVPVNKNNFKKTAEYILGERFRRDVTADVEYWNSMNEKLTRTTFADVSLIGIMKKMREELRQGSLTEADYAKQLQERTELYLRE